MDHNRRHDFTTRSLVEEGKRLIATRGRNHASLYLYRFGVPQGVIERTLAQEIHEAERAAPFHVKALPEEPEWSI